MAGYNKKIELVLECPALDETSGKRERGGWGKVCSWCKKNGVPQEAQMSEEERTSLTANGVNLDNLPHPTAPPAPRLETILAFRAPKGIIIHLDSDIAEQISGLDVSFTNSGTNRKEYCRDAIMTWLGMPEDRQILFVVATYCIETWFLATHDHVTDPQIFSDPVDDYEAIADVIEKLLALGYQDYTDETRNRTVDKAALTKGESKERFRRELFTVERRCEELQRVRQFFQGEYGENSL